MPKNNWKVFALSAAATVLVGSPAVIRGGGIYVPATEFTQLLNHVELLNQYARQVQQYQTQLRQYSNEIQQAQRVPTQLFGSIRSDLLGLQSVVQGGQALSYAMANFDSMFNQKFSGYSYAPRTDYTRQYAAWARTALDSTSKAIGAAHIQNQQLSSDTALSNYLDQQAKSTTGMLQALQVGNEIASQQVKELMKLRQLMMADLQEKGAYQANQVSQHFNDANAYESQMLFFTGSERNGYGSGGGIVGASSDTVPAATPVAPGVTPR